MSAIARGYATFITHVPRGIHVDKSITSLVQKHGLDVSVTSRNFGLPSTAGVEHAKLAVTLKGDSQSVVDKAAALIRPYLDALIM